MHLNNEGVTQHSQFVCFHFQEMQLNNEVVIQSWQFGILTLSTDAVSDVGE